MICIKSNEAIGGYEHISLFQYCPKCQVLNPGHLCDSSAIFVHDKEYVKKNSNVYSLGKERHYPHPHTLAFIIYLNYDILNWMRIMT